MAKGKDTQINKSYFWTLGMTGLIVFMLLPSLQTVVMLLISVVLGYALAKGLVALKSLLG
ncbi:MAG: hypothetical protein V2A55_03105 [Candidatus Jorgensenbacteria bacterium]